MTENELRETAGREARDFLDLLYANGPHQDSNYPHHLLTYMLLRYHSEGAVQACDNIASKFGVQIAGGKV